jgi:hypothetical protein
MPSIRPGEFADVESDAGNGVKRNGQVKPLGPSHLKTNASANGPSQEDNEDADEDADDDVDEEIYAVEKVLSHKIMKNEKVYFSLDCVLTIGQKGIPLPD